MRHLIVILSVSIALPTFTAFAKGEFWLFDIFTHFRVQMFAVCLLAAGFLLWRDRRWLSGFVAVAAIVNLVEIVAFYGAGGARADETVRAIRIISANVNVQTNNAARVAAFLKAEKPDVVIFLEASPRFVTEIEQAGISFPHKRVVLGDDDFGVAVLSHLPLGNVRVDWFGGVRVPFLRADIETPSGLLHLAGVHALSPVSAERTGIRNRQIRDLVDVLPDGGRRTLVVGDFNAAPWSHAFTAVREHSGLAFCPDSDGYFATWPAGIALLHIPIDHCLHGEGVQIARKWVGSDIGSDHYPIIVEAGLKD
ncbi:MAG: hypothetical protein HOH04_12295 [Rhodospirillaceae bacterium]|nr:hypothetical protein [Rhodospirillaceae bacterium]